MATLGESLLSLARPTLSLLPRLRAGSLMCGAKGRWNEIGRSRLGKGELQGKGRRSRVG
jgi:hypothetical protein